VKKENFANFFIDFLESTDSEKIFLAKPVHVPDSLFI